MVKKKSNTVMIIVIIIAIIVIGVVVWGFVSKWKFIGSDDKSEKKAQTQKKINEIMKQEPDTKVDLPSPEVSQKLDNIKKQDEQKIKNMSDSEIKQKMQEIKNQTTEPFQIKEGFELTSCGDASKSEIEGILRKALNLIRWLKPNLDVESAVPKLLKYYMLVCNAEESGAEPDKSLLCQLSLGNDFNPHTLGLYNSLDLIKPGGGLYGYRYWLFKEDDKQQVEWSSEPESREIRMLYKLYRYLKACPPLKKIDSDCVDRDDYEDAWGFTCKDKLTYRWLCDHNEEHSAFCCACGWDGSFLKPECTMECLEQNTICPATESNGLKMVNKCCKDSDDQPDYVRQYKDEWCKGR